MIRLLLLLLILPLTGCIQGELDAEIHADGSARLTLDLKAASAALGQPMKEWAEPAWLEAHRPTGLSRWAEPIYEKSGLTERLHLEAEIDNLEEFLLAYTEGGVVHEALAVERTPDGLDLRLGFLNYLERPLPIPNSEEKLGIDLTPSRVREMRSLFSMMLRGTEFNFRVHAPANFRLAEGFDAIQGSVATIQIDKERLLDALAHRSGALLDAEPLRDGRASLRWRLPKASQ